MNDRFLKACRQEPVDATPVWFMRQAGRYMPDYRALRQRYSLLEICRAPELAVAVTLQPVNAIDVDAGSLLRSPHPFTPMAWTSTSSKAKALDRAPDSLGGRRRSFCGRSSHAKEASRSASKPSGFSASSLGPRAAHRLRRCALHARGVMPSRERSLDNVRAHQGLHVCGASC